jgi:hypothetical protein
VAVVIIGSLSSNRDLRHLQESIVTTTSFDGGTPSAAVRCNTDIDFPSC